MASQLKELLAIQAELDAALSVGRLSDAFDTALIFHREVDRLADMAMEQSNRVAAKYDEAA